MRIVFGLVSLDPGGTELQTYLLANELSHRGHDVTVYLTSNTPNCPMGQCKFSIRATNSYIPHIKYLLQLIPKWRKWLLIDKPDIVVGMLGLPHIVLSFSTLGTHIPLLGRRGFSWPEILHLPNYQRMFRQIRLTRHWVIPRTKYLVCNAQHVRISAVDYEGWPLRKTSLIYNGWPEYPATGYNSLRTIYAGRNRVEKNYDILGVERVTNIPVWSDIGIYIHPTRAEGCSNSIGMAMAHAIPVVAIRTPGNEELLGNNYQALVENETSILRWIDLLQRSDSLRHYLGSMCHSRVRTHYSAKSMFDRWETLLSDTINHHSY